MPARWTATQEARLRKQLHYLYVTRNKTIYEVAKILDLSLAGTYYRMMRLTIPSMRLNKPRANSGRTDIQLPTHYSEELAEFIGIMLGDGHLTPTQVTVTLGTKEGAYVRHVAQLMRHVFRVQPKVLCDKEGCWIVYVGSTKAVRWLLATGLAHNKVKSQVTIPAWCFTKPSFRRGVLRGLIDTDGSVYKLRYGIQMSFRNESRPLVESVRYLMQQLGLRPSKISYPTKLYLTRRTDLELYFRKIGFSNTKHSKRYLDFIDDLGR